MDEDIIEWVTNLLSVLYDLLCVLIFDVVFKYGREAVDYVRSAFNFLRYLFRSTTKDLSGSYTERVPTLSYALYEVFMVSFFVGVRIALVATYKSLVAFFSLMHLGSSFIYKMLQSLVHRMNEVSYAWQARRGYVPSAPASRRARPRAKNQKRMRRSSN